LNESRDISKKGKAVAIADVNEAVPGLQQEEDTTPSDLQSPPPNSKFVEFGGGRVGALWE